MALPFPLAWGKRTYIMGIINLTPDSFSGDGLVTRGDPLEAALTQARAFVAGGVGGDFMLDIEAIGLTILHDIERRLVLPVVVAAAECGSCFSPDDLGAKLKADGFK